MGDVLVGFAHLDLVAADVADAGFGGGAGADNVDQFGHGSSLLTEVMLSGGGWWLGEW